MVTTTAGGRRWRRVLARTLRTVRTIVAAAAILLAVVLAGLALAPVRGALLDRGLAAASRALPGELEVGRSAWPHPGTIELRDLRWLMPVDGAPPDTLVHLRRLLLAVDTGELSRRDLAVDSLVVTVASVDLPAVRAALPPAAGRPSADSAAEPHRWSASLPRAGSVTGLPSAAVRHLVVHLERGRLTADLEGRNLDLAAAADLRAHREPAGTVQLTGGSLARTGPEPAQVNLDTLAVRVRWDAAWGGVEADSLRLVAAAAGPADVVARWRGREPLRVAGRARVRLAGGNVAGRVTLRATLPGLPLVGAARPAALDSTMLARVVATLEADGETRAGRIRGRARLDLGGSPGVDRALLALRVDLPDTAPAAGRVTVDTLAVAVPGVELTARGVREAQSIEARLTVAAHTPVPLLNRLVPSAVPVEGTVRGTLQVDGRLDDPRVGLDLEGDVRTDRAAVPWFRLGVAGDRRDLTASLAAGGGLAGDDSVAVDSLRVRLRARPAAPGELLDARRLRLDVTAGALGRRRLGRLRLAASAEMPREAPLEGVVDVDTLGLDWPGLAVHGSGRADTASVDAAFTAAVSSPCPLLDAFVPAVARADFTADLGLRVHGPYRDPRVALDLTGAVDAPEATVPRLALTARGDRRAFRGVVRAGGGLLVQGEALADSLVLTGAWRQADGDSLPLRAGLAIWRPQLQVGVAAAAGADSGGTAVTVRLDTLGLELAGHTLRLARPAVVRVDTAARRADIAGLDLEGSAGTMTLEGSVAPDRARLAADVALELDEAMLQAAMPAPIWSRDGGMDLSARGRVDLVADADTTRLDGGLDVLLHPHRDDPRLGIALRFGLDRGDTAGIGARFAVSAADTVLLHGSAVLPGRFDAGRRRWVPGEERSLLVDVPAQAVPTGFLRRVLPPGASLRGNVTVAAAAALPLAAPGDTTVHGRVEGTLRTGDLRVGLPNNSRVEIRADCRLSGAPEDPRIGGTVTIPSGFVRIPELPRSLLPVKGTPALWTVEARSDSLPVPGPAPAGRDSARTAWGSGAGPEAAPASLPDLDLDVTVPGNFTVHGYGLDAELAAGIRVTRGRDAEGHPGPSLRGEAHAVRGTLRFMNRNFDVRRAEVTFTGAVPPDPLLDVLLVTVIEGTTINLRVDGPASDPRIDLSSEPDLDRADIMAVLLFGRPVNDLSSDQRGEARNQGDPTRQLKENLAGLALAFGTADLQNSVSSTLGVDIVALGSDSSGGSTLTAGKYLGPKVLLKYNTSLEKSGTFFVTLEYTLSQIFRVVSTYGQGEQASGLELKWLRRY